MPGFQQNHCNRGPRGRIPFPLEPISPNPRRVQAAVKAKEPGFPGLQ